MQLSRPRARTWFDLPFPFIRANGFLYDVGSIAVNAAEPVSGSAANPVVVNNELVEGGEPRAGPSRIVVEGSGEEDSDQGSPLPVVLVSRGGDLIDFEDV